MAVDWTGYRLVPDLSGLAQGIANYGAQKQQAAQFQQEMDYKNRALAAEVEAKKMAMEGGANRFAPKSSVLPVYGVDANNNVFVMYANTDPNTLEQNITYRGLNDPNAQPDVSTLRIVGQEGLPSVSAATARAAGEKQLAINSADISSAYKLTAEQKRAETDALLARQAEQTNNGYEMMAPLLNQIDSVLSNKKKEIYSGTTWDYVKGTVAPKIGIVFDQNKLNDTITVRQNIATLRTMSKPPGSGNPTEKEWDRFDRMLPDPDTATRGELITGYNNYVKSVRNWYEQNKQKGASKKEIPIKEIGTQKSIAPTTWGEW